MQFHCNSPPVSVNNLPVDVCFILFLCFSLCIIGVLSISVTTNNACWASSASRVFVWGGKKKKKHFIYLLNWAGVLNIHLDMFCKKCVSPLNKLWHLCRFGTSSKACLSRGMYVKRWLLSTNKQHSQKKKGSEKKKEKKKTFALELVLHPGPVRDANDAP